MTLFNQLFRRAHFDMLSADIVAEQADSGGKKRKVSETDCECCVCLQEPDAEIFQCYSGHLICKQCYERIMSGPKKICPTCRRKFSTIANRNRFAEEVMSKRTVSCRNPGCVETMQRLELKKHLETECKKRDRSCRFEALGCVLKIKADAYEGHIQVCDYRASDTVLDFAVKNKAPTKHMMLQNFLDAPSEAFAIEDMFVNTGIMDSCRGKFVAHGESFELVLIKRFATVCYQLKRVCHSDPPTSPKESTFSFFFLPLRGSDIQFEHETVQCTFPKGDYNHVKHGVLNMPPLDVERALGQNLHWKFRLITRKDPSNSPPVALEILFPHLAAALFKLSS